MNAANKNHVCSFYFVFVDSNKKKNKMIIYAVCLRFWMHNKLIYGLYTNRFNVNT